MYSESAKKWDSLVHPFRAVTCVGKSITQSRLLLVAHIVSQLEETAGSSFMRWLYSIEMNIVAIKCVRAERRVSTTLRQVLTEFSELFMGAGPAY